MAIEKSEGRRCLENMMLREMARLLTREQYGKFRALITGMPDYEFNQIIAELRETTSPDMSLKDYVATTNEIHKGNGVNYQNTAMNDIPVRFLTEAENMELLTEINKSRTSDFIKLTREGDQKLIHLWEDSNNRHVADSKVSIPSDLFFAGTIPLMDCRIEIDERGKVSNGAICNYRVVIFNDYAEKLAAAAEDEVITVGAILLRSEREPKSELVFPIKAARGVDVLLGGHLGYRNMTAEQRASITKCSSAGNTGYLYIALLETWYGVQIALLHSVVRDLFRYPKTEAIHRNENKKSNNKKRRVCYIKRHIINAAELDKAIYGNNKAFTRRALIWYVIGHWRKQSDGRKVFVNPYWKGALRGTKFDETLREREIAQISGVKAGAASD